MSLTWSGCATSAKTASTMGTNILYFCGCRASSMMGITFGLFLAMFTKSLPVGDTHRGSGNKQAVWVLTDTANYSRFNTHIGVRTVESMHGL